MSGSVKLKEGIGDDLLGAPYPRVDVSALSKGAMVMSLIVEVLILANFIVYIITQTHFFGSWDFLKLSVLVGMLLLFSHILSGLGSFIKKNKLWTSAYCLTSG
eukprot:TRINITY_DN2050_c0_g1_i1.p1 TRINITY_DN2050_c0_g1~~TRINITY_DN2050_c0_g1_i1.p1  ORF type:complete len:103 (-),score=5.61 TRINITY_DN2050_c0_g1_i1:346-654(-)